MIFLFLKFVLIFIYLRELEHEEGGAKRGGWAQNTKESPGSDLLA